MDKRELNTRNYRFVFCVGNSQFSALNNSIMAIISEGDLSLLSASTIETASFAVKKF
jgi:hypothetical protein